MDRARLFLSSSTPIQQRVAMCMCGPMSALSKKCHIVSRLPSLAQQYGLSAVAALLDDPRLAAMDIDEPMADAFFQARTVLLLQYCLVQILPDS